MENKTTKQIETLIINGLESNFNFQIPLLSKAFNRVLAKVLAGVWQINYKTGNWIFLQMFVSTASFKPVTILGKTITPLVEWGRLIGTGDPNSGVQAIIDVDITVKSPGQILPSGTQLISSINNKIYLTTQAYTLFGPVDTIEVICADIGTAGNLDDDDPISFVNSIGIADRDAIVDTITTNGTDAETEAEYRERIVERFKERPQGGALVDYRIWASEVPGVAQTYWYTGDIPTYVIGYVKGDISVFPDRIPNTALLEAVGDACDYSTDENGVKIANRRPVTAIIDPAGDGSYSNINAITVKGFDVDIIDLVADDVATVKGLINTAVDNYFKEREPYIIGLSFPPDNSNVQQSAIIGVINTVIQANNASFLTAVLYLDGIVVPNYVLEEGQIANVDSILYNGV